MLKWTVGHKKTAGTKRSPPGAAGGGGSGPCYSIRRAAAKLHLSRRSRTSSIAGFDSQEARGRRSRSCDKENHGEGQGTPANEAECLSPRTRDSVYMRLDTIPAALRDLSNHQASPAGSPAYSGGVKRSRSRARKQRTTRIHEEVRQAVHPPDTSSSCTPFHSERTIQLTTSASIGTHDDSINRTPDERLPHQKTTLSPLQIEYSPCSLRTTKSLLALRRRITDAFVQPYHSVGTLHPIPQRSHDNPLYFALKGSNHLPTYCLNKQTTSELGKCDIVKSPTGKCDEVPIKFRRKDPSLCLASKKSSRYSTGSTSFSTFCKTQKLKASSSEDNILKKQPSQSKISLSPLSRNLASLRLSSGSKDGSVVQNCPRITPPSPFLNSSTYISMILSTSQNQKTLISNQLGMGHDITDPRFLSLYSVLDQAEKNVSSPKPETQNPLSSQNQESPHTPILQGPVNRVLCYPEDSPVKKLDSPQESRDYELRKRNSLRRTRTLTSNSEEGPPVKVQPVVSTNGTLALPVHSNESNCETGKVEKVLRLNSPNSKPSRKSAEIRTRKSLRRRSKLLNVSSENSSLKGVGDGVFTSGNRVCDSVFGNEESSSFGLNSDSLDGESMLKRQGGFRRRQRKFFRNSGASDSCLFKIPAHTNQHSGLTLPNGIPSPFSPQEMVQWPLNSNLGEVLDVSCHTVGLPESNKMPVSSHHNLYKSSATIINRLFGSVSCSNIPDRKPKFGLTLSKGIPSPPSPPNEDDDQYSSSVGITGVQPLSSSPVQSTGSAPVVPWRQRQSAVDESSASTSSDETWNSHNMHFMKTPRLTSAHVLSGATAEVTECWMQNERDSSNEPSVDPSPLALVERRSRSRRCLLFASPGGSTRPRRTSSLRINSWKTSRDLYKGELELSIYGNSGLLTVHVVSGRNLHRSTGKGCNAYVKVTLVPASEERTFHRTCVHKDSSAPWFDQRFSFEVLPSDLDKRVFVSAWHRDKEKRRSEFLGCMSFAVKHAVKKEISGSFRLLSQNAGRTQHVSADPPGGPGAKQPVMARQSDSSVEEIISIDDSDVAPTPEAMERRKSCAKKKVEQRAGGEDSSFLRHLELEPTADSGPGRGVGLAAGPSVANKGGRTPFTTTRRLTRHGNAGFGFSIAWTQPPRVERVESGLPADMAGLRPGDYVIFVEKYNVVTMPEEEILHLIRSCGNHLTLEVYRRASPNGLVGTTTVPPPPPRSSTTCSATTTSLDLSKRRLHLPQVTFSSEVGTGVIV